MQDPLSPRQLEFVRHSTARWNIAHGSVRSGKTVGSLFRFMQAVYDCPDSNIWMIGHTADTVYHNIVRLVLESEQLAIFRPHCSWLPGKRQLLFGDKVISTLGAKDEGAIGNIQGKSFSLFYGDEMTLYPESIIDMIDTRLSFPHSMGFATMNPSFPNHKIKQWIDKAEEGDSNYYALHFTLDDNPYVDQAYKDRIKNSLSGIFYKRNYLGLWCLAEGAIFDFFDKSIHVLPRAPRAADYYIAGIDYGTTNPFACLIIGVHTGKYTQTGRVMWVEKEYYWDCKKQGRQKTGSEYARDMAYFLEPYGIKQIYIDPSAASFKLEMSRLGYHTTDANNDVENGIVTMTSAMNEGNLYVLEDCKNTIREIESYVWDPKKALKGWDEPLKQNDHAVDALRYAIATHKVPNYKQKNDDHNPDDYNQNRFNPRGVRRF